MTTRSPRRRSVALVVPAAALLVIGSALPASAAVTVSSGSVSSDGSGDLIRPYCNVGALGASGTATTGDACAGLTSVTVFAEGGADTVNLTDLADPAFPALRTVQVYLGDDAVADEATGSSLNEAFNGEREDTASGGAGDDWFDGVGTALGGLGDDVFKEAYAYAAGGPGDDRFVQFIASSGIEGGEGLDTWEADFDQSAAGSLPAGLIFTMGPLDLTLVAPGVSQTVPVSGVEHLEIGLLRVSDDTWQGAGFAGSQNVRAFSGNDAVTGGGLDDALSGGLGNDTLTGGGGRDALEGGAGNDTIQARDGVADLVDCGEGVDSVVADAADLVANCETVSLPPPPPPAVVPVTGSIGGPAKVSKPKKATFTFSSTTAGATFQCKVDDKAFKACASPYKVATKKLKAGKHTLLVRAVVGGVVDATPSKKTFKVRKG